MSDPVMKYGLHAGKRVSELPIDYVMWWADSPMRASKEHAQAKAIVARAVAHADRYIGDYVPGRGLWENYDPQDEDRWDHW